MRSHLRPVPRSPRPPQRKIRRAGLAGPGGEALPQAMSFSGSISAASSAGGQEHEGGIGWAGGAGRDGGGRVKLLADYDGGLSFDGAGQGVYGEEGQEEDGPGDPVGDPGACSRRSRGAASHKRGSVRSHIPATMS
jgi:hypothetical protein